MSTAALTEAVFYILLSLDAPLHGYGIMQNVERLSGGRVRLAAGTLYGALTTLTERGWIEAVGEDEGRRKEYRITPEGRAAVRAELARVQELTANGEALTRNWTGLSRGCGGAGCDLPGMLLASCVLPLGGRRQTGGDVLRPRVAGIGGEVRAQRAAGRGGVVCGQCRAAVFPGVA